MDQARIRYGFTLIELAVVVALVALVASIAARRFTSVRSEARILAAECDMAAIRDAFVGSEAMPGFLDDLGSVPGFSPAYLRVPDLLSPTNLFVYGGVHPEGPSAAAFAGWNPAAKRGWRGPYVRLDSARSVAAAFPEPEHTDSSARASYAASGFFPSVSKLSLPEEFRKESAPYGFPGEPALLDPWGNPYVLQIPPPQAFVGPGGTLANVPDEERFRYARLVSAGPDGVLSTPCFFGNTNATGSAWMPEQRRASIFGGRTAERGDDLVLFLRRADRYREDYEIEGDER